MKFKVTKSDGSDRFIRADYAKVEEGVLVFRNSGRNAAYGGYPILVKAYAPGSWSEITKMREEA